MRYERLQRHLPRSLVRYLLHFEAAIEDAVRSFAAALPTGARVLDAGAGESQHAPYFANQKYLAVDLALGDASWNYGHLDVIGDLTSLPLATESCDAALNVVTLEHVREPASALREIARVLRPGGRLLLIVPHEWEVHQSPHDFFRYTIHGVEHLLMQAGFVDLHIAPAGGYFRLMSRRLLNGLRFFPGLLFPVAALVLVPPALLLPLLDRMDRDRHFTLGYVCTASKRS